MDPLEEFLANLNSSTPNYTPLDATEDPYVAPEPNATPYNTFADLPGTSYSPTLGADGIPTSQVNFTPGVELGRAEAVRAANQFGIDPQVFTNLISQESNFDPEAYNAKVGATGYGQLIPSTARGLGVNIDDPFKNMYGGAKLLSQNLKRREGNYPLALADYNAGPVAVDAYGGEIPPYKETQNYVKNVMGPPIPQMPFGPKATPSPSRAYPETSSSAAFSASAPMESSPSGLMGSQRRQQDLSRVMQELTSLQDTKTEALKGIARDGELDPNDAIAVALTAIIPTLLGWATHGKQGAAGGATAGAAGAGVGLAGLTAEQKERNATNKLIYEDAKQRLVTKEAEAKAVRDSIFDREEKVSDLQYTEAGKDRRTGKIAGALTRPDPGGVALDAETKKDIRGRATIAASGQDVINFITQKTPELLTEQYKNPDGSIDWSGAADILVNRAKGVVGPESDIGAAKQKIEQFLSEYQKQMSGLAATDNEFNRLYGQLYEKGILNGQLLPTSIPTAMETIQEFIKKQRTMAITDVQAARAANSGTEEAIGNLFNQYMGAPGEPTRTPETPSSATNKPNGAVGQKQFFSKSLGKNVNAWVNAQGSPIGVVQ